MSAQPLKHPGTRSIVLFTLLFIGAALPTFASSPSENKKKCMYVSSYHEGHNWSDSIEASIREKLEGHCELRKFDMDSKRNPSLESIFNVTNSIIKTIEDWQPDVVITSDDNAAKHLIAQHYRDDKIPFVFSGVDWSVEEYGFPYQNVTGIVEVAPIKTMFREALTITKQGRRAVYLGPDNAAEKKNFSRMELIAEEFEVELQPLYYSSFSQWKKAMHQINEFDFAVLGSSADTKDWNLEEAMEVAIEVTRKPTFTADIWMMPYTAFGFTKLASEQGEWAAEVAIRILEGTNPQDIPLAINKKWEFWANEDILNKLEATDNRRLLRKAKRLQLAAYDQ